MTADHARVIAAVDDLRRTVAAASRRGPVPLANCFAETGLGHVEIPALTRGAVVAYLQQEGIPVDDLGDPADAITGFIVTAGRVGWAFVNGADIIPRRRFTAAHELGHFLLHRGAMGHFRADTDATLQEAGAQATDQMEQEANRFAVELLMPADVCRAAADELRRRHRCCPRGVLGYRLASELLVSREAMRYRLRELEVGDE